MINLFILLYILSIVIASYSQVLLKKGAASKQNIFINKFTIIGYLLMGISTLFSLIGYNGVTLAFSQMLQILGFFFVTLFGFLFLKEKISLREFIGLFIVIIGIIVYSIEV